MEDRQDSWSAYWRLGGLTTLTAFREGYTGELAEFWHPLLDALPDGARVLDLATGNGAVALLALRRGRALGRRFEIEGVDVAAIDPVAHAGRSPQVREELEAISFHPRTPLERTGLAGASYDLVTSQYGMEYGDLQAAVREVARLLVPGGRFGAILHSAGSQVARTAANVEALLVALLDQLALPQRVRSLLAQVGTLVDPQALARTRVAPATAAGWAELEQAVARARAYGAHDDEMRGTTHGFLQRLLAPFDRELQRPLPDKLALVEQVEGIARGLLQRMRALRRCALDEPGLARLLGWLGEAGLAAEPVRTVHFGAQREEMGYGVVARRA